MDGRGTPRTVAKLISPGRTGCAWLLGAALPISLPAQAFLGRLAFTAGDHFAGATLRRGILATEERCRQQGRRQSGRTSARAWANASSTGQLA